MREALGVALVEAREATVAWLRLGRLAFFPMSCGAQKLFHALAPYARRAAVAFVTQPRELLLLEAALLGSLLFVWRLRVLIRRQRYLQRLRDWASSRLYRPAATRYARFAEGVRQRSRIIARALPHAAYALLCLLVLRASRALGLEPVLRPLWPHVAALLLTPLPWARTLLTLRSDGSVDRVSQRGWLSFWVLWATCRLASGLTAAMPFVSRLLPAFALDWTESPALAPAVACVALWAQLPHDGLSLACGVVGPPLSARAQRLSEALPSLPAGLSDKAAVVLQLLMTAPYYATLAQVMQEGWLLTAAAACLLTPYPFTGVVLLYWSLVYPTLRSIDALEIRGASAEAKAEAAYACQVQLRYWLLHCAASALLQQLPWLLWLPFATHAQIVLAVWLQLPYFRAATLLFLQLTPVGRLLLRYTAGDAPAAGAPLLTFKGDAGSPASGTQTAASRQARSPRANATYSKRLQPERQPNEKKGREHQE